MPSPKTLVVRRDGCSFQDFAHDHLIPNQPLILSAATSSNWWAIRTLVTCQGGPNYQALGEYGSFTVPVAYTAEREYSEFRRTEMALSEVLELWESGAAQGKTMYIKDWQLSKELVARGLVTKDDAYELPAIFHDDWMTPRLRDTDSPDDFRFTYLGPEGTFTPLHADVYNSYSWSTNLCGRKKWWLFPPGTQPVGCFDLRDLNVPTGAIEVVQMPGETIFVPSGWWHQVVNLDFCISVNQNWFNSITLPSVYEHLVQNQMRVEVSIQDVKDLLQEQYPPSDTDSRPQRWELEWVQAVQELLKQDAGWNWCGFWQCIADNLERPPAPRHLSPPIQQVNDVVTTLLDRFRLTREAALLTDLADITARVQNSLQPADGLHDEP